MHQPTKIIADYRERQSGIPELLFDRKQKVTFKQLKTGDYILNEALIIERKTATDFIQSLIDGRLFNQCHRLRKTGMACLFIIEGNPFKTNHNINREAIRGALLSVMSSWQVPVFFSADKENTAQILNMACCQQLRYKPSFSGRSGRTKKLNNPVVYFLAGLPKVGLHLAGRLLDHFGNIRNIILAEEEELRKIKGIGKVNALKIIEFIRARKSSH